MIKVLIHFLIGKEGNINPICMYYICILIKLLNLIEDKLWKILAAWKKK